MNKKEKLIVIDEDKVNYIVDVIVKAQSDLLYEVINENIFDEGLAEESDDKTYKKVYNKIYERVLWKLIKRGKGQ